MALVTTTLAAAITATAKNITVASATSVAVGRLVIVGGETMQVTKGYVTASTTVPVLRGQAGTASAAHPTTATVIHGESADFQTPGAQANTTHPTIRPWKVVSYTGTPNTFTLPTGGENVHVILNGTTADTFTIPIPTADMNGTRLLISSNGVAQHILTFTGGVCGAGASYDLITINAAAPASFEFVAVDILWHSICGAAIGGTTTNIAGTIA